uniref:Uncharacterized protein n=1 Tax=Aegilops tauschii subsp. strangulata TaxID=200361 RepID=A0A453LP87_AEGTS
MLLPTWSDLETARSNQFLCFYLLYCLEWLLCSVLLIFPTCLLLWSLLLNTEFLQETSWN